MSKVRVELIPSSLMGRPQSVAILPPDRLTEGGRCFTLYLLHGTGGDHMSWCSNAPLEEMLAGLPIAAVMPSAGNSFYLDSEIAPMESFLCDELLPYVDERLPTIRCAGGRAVSGLSMGGYGALLLALRRPDLFGSAASHSGAVLTARATTEVGVKWVLADSLYGAGASGDKRRADHDILTLAHRMIREASPGEAAIYLGPDLYLDCGQSDFLYYASRELTSALRMLRIPYEYHEVPGDHDWDFWRSRFPAGLAFHRRKFERFGA